MNPLTAEQEAWRDGYEAGGRAVRDTITNTIRTLPTLTVKHPGQAPETWVPVRELAQLITERGLPL